ncbi:MAG: hypothetical protein Ct9H300mP8_06590 [Gammaproteobacteria bacterium]|nr:MAG: hypothetical protein Ct9H300mP8_06590 [Gammaproteobacteria bacterium]
MERESRRITVYSLELLTFLGSEMTFSVHCSKGTYVRTIADDLGEQLECGAHVVGNFAGSWRDLSRRQIW